MMEKMTREQLYKTMLELGEITEDVTFEMFCEDIEEQGEDYVYADFLLEEER